MSECFWIAIVFFLIFVTAQMFLIRSVLRMRALYQAGRTLPCWESYLMAHYISMPLMAAVWLTYEAMYPGWMAANTYNVALIPVVCVPLVLCPAISEVITRIVAKFIAPEIVFVGLRDFGNPKPYVDNPEEGVVSFR